MAKSIIAYHETIQLSPTLLAEKYTYVYVDGVDANRENIKHKSKNRFGWEKVAFDSVGIKGKGGNMWVYHEIWQKKKRKKSKQD